MVAGAAPVAAVHPDPPALAVAVAEREAAGEARKEAIAAVAVAVGVPKRVVFDAVVAARNAPAGTGSTR